MKKISWFLITAFWLVADQWTKILSVSELKDKLQTIDVLPILRWYYAENHGAAFSLLANQPGWQKWFFIIVGCIAIIAITTMIIKSNKDEFYALFGLSCILGGAIGNVYDRAILGYVRDMISVYYTPWDFYFAIFNVADVAISVGVFFMIIDWIMGARKKAHT